MLALIGPNGAGKTTCFNMINGQIAPTSGAIHIFGRRSDGLGARAVGRLGVGRTFQVAATFASMTLAENVQTALLARERALWPGFTWAYRRRVERFDAAEYLIHAPVLARDESTTTPAYATSA